MWCLKSGLKTGNGQAKERRKQTMTTKLLEEILSKENLEKACTAVVRNKGASGVDGMKVDELKGYICKHGNHQRWTRETHQ